MHLPELPTIFVKDGVERKAFFTVEARDLRAAGWVEKGQEKPVTKAPAKAVAKPAQAEKLQEEKPKVEKAKSTVPSTEIEK